MGLLSEVVTTTKGVETGGAGLLMWEVVVKVVIFLLCHLPKVTPL